MKKMLVLLLTAVSLTVCFAFSASAAIAEFSVNFSDNGDGTIRLENYGYYDPSFVGSVGFDESGLATMSGYFFGWESNASLLSLSLKINNLGTKPRTLNFFSFEDIPYRFNIGTGKLLGTQAVKPGTSSLTWIFANPRNESWLVLAPEAGGEAFNLAISDVRLNNYSSQVPAPLPILLLGSGLVGLIGLKRHSLTTA